MPLSEQEKIGLTQQLAMLLEGNEPESVLATLQRVAERMAHRVTRADITELEALRWQSLADACVSVQRELERANAPRSRFDASVSPNDEGLDGIDRRSRQSAPQAQQTPQRARPDEMTSGELARRTDSRTAPQTPQEAQQQRDAPDAA